MGQGRFWQRWEEEGGGRELLQLAWPLILSNSFWMMQITIDRVLLTQFSYDAVGAAMAAALFFWTPLALLQNTAGYATTFVAQYTGAGRPHRVGPAIWQALHFSWVAGLAFLLLVPLAGPMFSLVAHDDPLPELETIYFRCLCFSALPMLITAAATSFFTGRGDSRTVLLVNGVGFLLNALLDLAWIQGRWGFPAWGIAGAGWATVAGCWASAILALGLLFRRVYREEFNTLGGWRVEWPLLGRLLWFGVPTGIQWALEGLAFSVFLIIVGLVGRAELAASSIAFTVNMVAFLPTMGIGQAVSVLVGQRLGQDRPAVAERTTWTGFGVAWLYMALVAGIYLAAPGLFLAIFHSDSDPVQWAIVVGLVPVLLRFVAVYSLFDSMNAVFSFALRGAGDTRFVTVVSIALAWPVMVLPSWLVWKNGHGLEWAWGFASAYVIALALVMMFRFQTGKWKNMRVIEPVVIPDEPMSEGGGAGKPEPASPSLG